MNVSPSGGGRRPPIFNIARRPESNSIESTTPRSRESRIASWEEWARLGDPFEKRNLAVEIMTNCLDNICTELQLSHLNLTDLPDDLPDSLIEINVNKNRLTCLPHDWPPAFRKGCFSGNLIDSVSTSIFEDLHGASLDLDDNPLSDRSRSIIQRGNEAYERGETESHISAESSDRGEILGEAVDGGEESETGIESARPVEEAVAAWYADDDKRAVVAIWRSSPRNRAHGNSVHSSTGFSTMSTARAPSSETTWPIGCPRCGVPGRCAR